MKKEIRKLKKYVVVQSKKGMLYSIAILNYDNLDNMSLS